MKLSKNIQSIAKNVLSQEEEAILNYLLGLSVISKRFECHIFYFMHNHIDELLGIRVYQKNRVHSKATGNLSLIRRLTEVTHGINNTQRVLTEQIKAMGFIHLHGLLKEGIV